MIENESDRCRIAKSLNIEIRSAGLQKDYIYHDIMDIAQCGFNHIIIIGSCYCDLLFLDCYERVFRWDSMTDVLWFIGNFSKAVLEKPYGKPYGVPWGVSGDGTVWELETGTYTCFYLNLSPIANFFSYRFGFARRKQFSPCKRQEKRQEQEPKEKRQEKRQEQELKKAS